MGVFYKAALLTHLSVSGFQRILSSSGFSKKLKVDQDRHNPHHHDNGDLL
jgi:hypothetical protein